jgi:hypothetical protein
MSDTPSSEQTPESAPEGPSKEELRLAMKAFRKRLKLTQLDDDSRLGHGAMTGGSKSRVAAITPPDQFSKAIWMELANQGKLRREGGGLYSLVEQQ